MAGTLYAGTSGFSYESWRGGFYPRDARPSEFLRLYAERLPAVELIATFRRLPTAEQVRRWTAQTPPGFRFAPKLSARITHGGDLALARPFCQLVRGFGERLGPVRVQLVRRRDDGFLQQLLRSLDPKLRYAFDLEHESWAGEEVDEALAEAGAVRVGALGGAAPFRFLRLREPPYDEAALAGWAERLRQVLAAGADVFCFFKHEDDPRGAAYARRLLELAR